ncbi:nuclear transport factor 2 family protein [Paraferrimonas sp. SM1919]|uniref:nuclear transport factor 2 family protein n=1 Tax=Paraferrimonas sp. SM1919 TaxID=2662263 RepID=UPI0013D14F2A|nr:nuclear transport factor 2 family protein [Paraferrimonas sp. SM1919]
MNYPSTKAIALKLIENISSEGAIENDAVIELMSDDVVIEMIPGASEAYLPFNGVYRGHAGARTWLALLEEYLMVEHIDRTYVCEGEYCFAFGNGLFTYAGMKVPFSFSEVVKVEQGKVTWYKEWVDCTKIVEMVKGRQYPKSTTNN